MKEQNPNRIIIDITPEYFRIVVKPLDGSPAMVLEQSSIKEKWVLQNLARFRAEKLSEHFEAIRVSDNLGITVLVLLYPDRELQEQWERESAEIEKAEADEEPPDDKDPPF